MPNLLTILAQVVRFLLSDGATRNSQSRRTPTRSLPDAPARLRRKWKVDRLLAAGAPEAVLLDSRRGVALIVAYRALAVAAERRGQSSERLSDQAEAAYRRSVVRGGR